MKLYDAVFFDVDGTLIDSAPGILNTLREVFAAMQKDITGVDLMRYVGPPLRKSFAEHFADEADVEQAVELYRASYKVKGSHQCTLYPGAAEMLNNLKAAGIRLFTATSKPVTVVTPILEELGVADLFEEIGGASMTTERDTKTAVIRYLLDKPELQGCRILMVGDRRDDMRGAADCGLPTAAVTYGYGSVEELEPFAPKFMADSCAALQRYILEGETT